MRVMATSEAFEYGFAYWVDCMGVTHGLQESTYIAGIATSPAGTKLTKADHKWRLAFENELGSEGWLIWQDWNHIGHGLGTYPAQWLVDLVKAEFPEFAESLVTVSVCRIRRRVSQ
jgi:hypothetical protein